MEMAAMARPAGTGDDGSVSTAPYGAVIIWLVWSILLALLTVAAVLSQVATPAGAVDQLSVTGSPDAGGIDKGLTGNHVFQTQVAARSKIAQSQVDDGCARSPSKYRMVAAGRLSRTLREK